MSIIGNDIRDCYSVGVYINTARAVRVEGNVIRAIDQAHRRKDSGHLIDGVLLGSEHNDGPDFGAQDLVIANNLVLGTHNGISWWDDDENGRASNTYQRVQIVSNVVWGSEENAIMFDKVPRGRTAPNGVVLTDNILYDGAAGASLQIADPAAWTITANLFPDGVPAAAGDASNITGDPLLAAPAVGATPESFRPSATSPARHAGRPVAAVPLDFACATRGTADTTIGAFE
jgi:nitrous oxidase accessory protein NosD